MKAISPVRSVRNCYKAVCCISEQSLPAGALCDMNDCYSRLKQLVPSIPQNKSVSQVEILQHVIDYIFDLQIALQAEEETTRSRPEVLLSIQTADLTHNFPKEEGQLCH
uniref:Inhibitor of DNA binding 3 n=1 Tax=Cynoglossus semilaevis TaxID=244447 RepID=A0A3P8UQM2_CYNSE